jgi:hypothetical protein
VSFSSSDLEYSIVYLNIGVVDVLLGRVHCFEPLLLFFTNLENYGVVIIKPIANFTLQYTAAVIRCGDIH